MAKKNRPKQNTSVVKPLALGTLSFAIPVNDAPKSLTLSATKKSSDESVNVKSKNSNGYKTSIVFDSVDYQDPANPLKKVRVFHIDELVVEDVDFKSNAKDVLASGKLTITIKTG